MKYTKKLEAAGFTREQAEAQVYVQHEAISEAMEHEAKTLVTKEDLQKELAPMKTDIAVLKWMIGMVMAGVAALVLKAFFMV